MWAERTWLAVLLWKCHRSEQPSGSDLGLIEEDGLLFEDCSHPGFVFVLFIYLFNSLLCRYVLSRLPVPPALVSSSSWLSGGRGRGQSRWQCHSASRLSHNWHSFMLMTVYPARTLPATAAVSPGDVT